MGPQMGTLTKVLDCTNKTTLFAKASSYLQLCTFFATLFEQSQGIHRTGVVVEKQAFVTDQ